MTAIRVYFKGERFGPVFVRSIRKDAERVRAAARGAAQDVANQIVLLGQGDIASAGNFGSRWTEGLKATVTEGGGNIRINVTHDVSYFNIFQYGGVIAGKPMLWIPLSAEFGGDAQGVRARDYGSRLFRVPNSRTPNARAGKAPLLLSYDDRQPKYFGKESVTIPKKFHIVEIARAAAQRMRDVYVDHFASGD